MEQLNDNNTTIDIINKKVSYQISREITKITYDTWLKCVENAFIENCNIVIPVDNEFTKNIMETRYLELIANCYKLNNRFENIEFRVVVIENRNSIKVFKIKSALEMKAITTSILEEEISIDVVVQDSLKDILHQIKIIALTGSFSITIILSNKQNHEKVMEKIMSSLKDNGYNVNLETLSDKRKILDINWR